ncbi:hypothetical protein TNCT_492371 [Trichonephila clavata]|uniref:Uncharacterized protein n=1 Tax=Trichonephila clavata TaxID=2740835 RepID=A0A8X6HQ84_TRICU|nr:hypothetical protein TNCT_492371 [Trichonephila clavata]
MKIKEELMLRVIQEMLKNVLTKTAGESTKTENRLIGGRRGGGIHYALRNSISVDPSRLRLFGKGKEKPLLEYAGAAQPVWWLCPSACYRVGSGSRLEWKAANPFCLCWMYTCMKHTSTTTLLYMCSVSLSQRSMNVVATSRVNI